MTSPASSARRRLGSRDGEPLGSTTAPTSTHHVGNTKPPLRDVPRRPGRVTEASVPCSAKRDGEGMAARAIIDGAAADAGEVR